MARNRPRIDRPDMDYLAHLGPFRVAAGTLDAAGMPGVMFAPIPRGEFSTTSIPLVSFGHGWLQPIRRYADTLRYLASWGIVAIAPATETGPFPSHLGFAADLNTSLALACNAKLGHGQVTIDPERLGLAGHSLGGGVAVLAAATNPAVKAVATINAADTRPSAVTAAGLVTVPGLHLVGGKDSITPAASNGEKIARAWAGPVQLRTLKKAAHLSIAEGGHWSSTFIGDSNDKGSQHLARMLLTAFFLQHLSGQDQLAEELAGKISGTTLEEISVEV